MYSSLHVIFLANMETTSHTGSQLYLPPIVGDIPAFSTANYSWHSVCGPRWDASLS